MEEYKRLGDVFRKRRTQMGLSIKNCGNLCGVSDSYISLLERGRLHKPEIIKVFEIATKLSIQPSELYQALGYADDTRLRRISLLSDNNAIIVQAFIDFLLSQQSEDIGGNNHV